jgi:hypothetical protein
MKHLKSIPMIAVFLGALLLTQCTYDVNVGRVITDPVSFANDLLPIFNQSCNSSGCHNTGGVPPDLTTANAYDALISGGYINLSAPDRSELYLWMRGERGLPMPLSGPNENYNALVLAWITQGALNN